MAFLDCSFSRAFFQRVGSSIMMTMLFFVFIIAMAVLGAVVAIRMLSDGGKNGGSELSDQKNIL